MWRTEETLWHDVVTKSPGNARGLMNYGLTLMEKGDYAGALRYYKQAQAIAPRYSILFINLAIAEGATGQDADAEHHFREALQLAPDRPDSRTYYAKWLLKHSRLGEALGLATEAVELAPGDVMASELLAEINKMVSRAPTPELFLTQSLSYYRAQRYQDSISAAKAALALRRDYAEAWNNIGAANNAMGRYDEAVQACQEALRLKPGYELAANNLRFALERQAAKNAK